MKVLYISDLHVDRNSVVLGVEEKHLVHILINKINYESKKDGLIGAVYIVGDLCWGIEKSLYWLDYIEERISLNLYFIPGNHEMMMDKFNIDNNITTLDSEDMLRIYKKSKWNMLDKEISLGKDSVLISTLGWYDYSFYNEHLKEKNKKILSNEELTEFAEDYMSNLNAGKYISFDNLTLSAKELDNFKKSVEKVNGKNITVVTHFVPSIKLLRDDLDESHLSALVVMGNSSLGNYISSVSNITDVIYGHNHILDELEHVIKGKNYRIVSIGSKHNWGNNTFEDMLDKMTYIK